MGKPGQDRPVIFNSIKELTMIWYLKQLLPLAYASTYTADGKRCRSTWRMWFGRCFNIHTIRWDNQRP